MTLDLEAFDRERGESDPAPPVNAGELAAFERGHRAGWDDAMATQSDEMARLRAGFGQALADMSFSYTQARAEVLRQIAPVLRTMVEKVLPRLADATFVDRMAEVLGELAARSVSATFEIAVSPANLEAAQALADTPVPGGTRIVASPDIGPGQAMIRCALGERAIDIDGLLAAMEDAVMAFATQSQAGETLHG